MELWKVRRNGALWKKEPRSSFLTGTSLADTIQILYEEVRNAGSKREDWPVYLTFSEAEELMLRRTVKQCYGKGAAQMPLRFLNGRLFPIDRYNDHVQHHTIRQTNQEFRYIADERPSEIAKLRLPQPLLVPLRLALGTGLAPLYEGNGGWDYAEEPPEPPKPKPRRRR